MSLCLRWFEHREAHDLGKSSICRKRKRLVISDCLELRAPLGVRSEEAQRPEISRENVAHNNISGIISSTVATDKKSSTRVTPLITPKRVNMGSIESLMTSHSDAYINKLNDRIIQMGEIMTNPSHSHCDIMQNYKEVSKYLRDAEKKGNEIGISFFWKQKRNLI